MTSSGAQFREAVTLRGSKPFRLALNREAGRVIAVDMGAKHWRVAIDTLRPDLDRVRWEDGKADVIDDPWGALERIVDEVEKQREGIPNDEIAVIVVGVPFSIHDNGRVRSGDKWKTFDPYHAFKEALPWARAVAIESDAGLGAVAELQAVSNHSGTSPTEVSMTYVKWSSQLTAGVVVGGTVVRGDGLGGSFLHDPVDVKHLKCDVCGRACTAEFARLPTILARVKKLGGNKSGRRLVVVGNDSEERAAALFQLTQAQADVAEVVKDSARAIGRSLGHAANVTGPSHVVIGGAFKGRAAMWLVNCVADGFKKTATPAIVRHTSIWAGSYTGRAAVVGGIALGATEYAVPYLYQKYLGDRIEDD